MYFQGKCTFKNHLKAEATVLSNIFLIKYVNYYHRKRNFMAQHIVKKRIEIYKFFFLK